MPDWNPDLYLKFRNERTQPSIDLAAKIELESPASILDIGCGPGNSTQVLARRWPEAEVAGLDNSASMIEKAGKDHPGQRWILGDAASFEPGRSWDLVFSNASIQWIPDHERLIPKFFGLVAKGGALAIQIPRFDAMPLYRAIVETAAGAKYRDHTRGCGELSTYHDESFYYGLLSGPAARLDMWETSYFHVLGSLEALGDFIRSTGMKPYLDRLPAEADRRSFEAEALERCRDSYPARADGRILFPFRRLFFVAYRA